MPKLPSEDELQPTRAKREPDDDPQPTDHDPAAPVFDDAEDLPEDYISPDEELNIDPEEG